MKTSAFVAVIAGCCLVSCDREEPSPSAAKDPVPSSETVESAPPAAVPVTEPGDFKVAEEEPGNPDAPSPTPGERLDHAIEKTEQGLGTAKDKTEEGLRKAAEKTGNFLQRTGETIERKASGQ